MKKKYMMADLKEIFFFSRLFINFQEKIIITIITEKMDNKGFSRRDFISGSVALGVTGAVSQGMVTSCIRNDESEKLYAFKERELHPDFDNFLGFIL